MNYNFKYIQNASKIKPFHRTRLKYLLFSLLLINILNAQTRVSSSVDSTQIKIGEQIQFKVEVEADTTASIVFPEGQTFLPMEVVEESAIDTIINNDKFNLIKKYALTQFDSGAYTLPRQQIIVNNKAYFTDSLNIKVNTVVVDTTRQKMFDIKPITEVEKSSKNRMAYLIYIAIFLAVTGGLLYWFVFRKKPLTEAEKTALLPPYDRALLALKKLDESRYLIQSEYKTYYSQLTGIVRSYLEEEVNVAALESTTNELIAKLELLKDAETLNVDDNTIKQFKNVLQTADLVKFARSRPETRTAEQHRKLMEQIVGDIKEALPAPSEEDLLKNEEYLIELARKKRKKKIVRFTIASAIVIVLISAGSVWYYGFNNVKDSIIGHPTKALLEGEWVASEYGYPAISVETPEVLKRTPLALAEEIKAAVNTNQVFTYGSLTENFYIMLSSTTYKKDAETDIQKAIDASITAMEAEGAKNIIVKKEDFVTQTGIEGIKVFGAMNIEHPDAQKLIKGEYIILNFTQNGGFQQIVIVHENKDNYAEQIVNRIINSIDFKAGT